MKKILKVLTLVLLTQPLLADTSAKEIAREHFLFVETTTNAIVGFETGIADLSAKIGRPLETTESLYKRNFRKLSWPGLEVYTLPKSDTIIVIVATGLKVATVDGVKVGDSKELVIDRYGVPQVERHGYVEYNYYDFSEPWGLRFELDQKGAVDKIVMGRID